MHIGFSAQRLDAAAKATGRARYAGDDDMPGMRHAVFVRSDMAHGMVTSVDASAALALPGVEAVFTADDVPDVLFPTAGHPYSLDHEHGDVADRLLLTRHVRYYGDEVAIVVARDALTAAKAARLVKMTCAPLPVMTSAESALAADAYPIHPEINSQGNVLGRHTLEVNGNFDEVSATADLLVAGAYSTPTMQHCHLENHVAYAYMEDMHRIVIVSSTQIPHICRRIVEQALGIPWSSVRVIKPCVGGGFGNKQDVVLEPMVAFLTWKLGGAPVRLELHREEEMLCTRVRHAFAMQGRAAVKKDGTLLGYALDVLSNTGAYASHGHSIAAAGGSKVCYVYPHAAYRFSATTYYSNIPVGGACRGYGSPQTAYGVECLMDDAARALDMDPLEFRLKNTGEHGDISPLNKTVVHTLGVSDCLRHGADRFGWSARKGACRAFNAEAIRSGSPLRRGVGLSVFSYGTGTYPVNVEAGSARLTLNQDGTITIMTGATEIGQGADTAFAQMAAETLGVPLRSLHVFSTQDTDVSPWDTGAYASRQTFTCAPAIQKAASMLRERILEHAAAMTGHIAAALTLAPAPKGAAVVFARAPQIIVVGLHELAMDAYYHKERGAQLTAEASMKSRKNPPSFGACFAEVEVDIPLCKIRIRDILNVHDAGVLINPALAAAQVQGGMGMGIGWALYEELLVDQVTGRVHNHNLLDYKLPTFCDMPDLACDFVETREPAGAYGNKALGEPPIISPAPAIRNALLDATNVAIGTIPLTPKLLFTEFCKAGLIRCDTKE